jgi:hypothetical protein
MDIVLSQSSYACAGAGHPPLPGKESFPMRKKNYSFEKHQKELAKKKKKEEKRLSKASTDKHRLKEDSLPDQ